MSLFIDWLEIEQDFGVEIPEDVLLSIYGEYLMVTPELYRNILRYLLGFFFVVFNICDSIFRKMIN